MKKILCATIFCCCISAVSHAQIIYLNETVYVSRQIGSGATNTNPFHGFTFSLEGDYTVRKVGHTGRHIRPYLQDSPEAIKELDKFKTKRSLATTAGLTAVGYFIVAAAVELSKSKDDPAHPNTDSGPNFGVMFGPPIGLLIVDYILAGTSNKNLRRAVEFHNKKVALGDLRSKPKLVFGSSRTSLGISVAIQF